MEENNILMCISIGFLLQNQQDKVRSNYITRYNNIYHNSIENLYYIAINKKFAKNIAKNITWYLICEEAIMEYFDIDYDLYKNIVKKYNGIDDIVMNPNGSDYNLFLSKKDCLMAIDELTPLIMANILMKG